MQSGTPSFSMMLFVSNTDCWSDLDSLQFHSELSCLLSKTVIRAIAQQLGEAVLRFPSLGDENTQILGGYLTMANINKYGEMSEEGLIRIGITTA